MWPKKRRVFRTNPEVCKQQRRGQKRVGNEKVDVWNLMI